MKLEERIMLREKKAREGEEMQKRLDEAVEKYTFRPQVEGDK